jgi:hypothetical protein
MGKKKSPKQDKKAEKLESRDWISALAKQATKQSTVPSKAERIERRNAKKRRRENRKPQNTMHKVTMISSDHNGEEYEQDNKSMNRLSEAHFSSLERTLHNRVASLHDKSSRPYETEQAKKGKATAGYRLNDEAVQPRRRDYGGLGLARPSMFLSLRDPSFVPKLEEEFAEHVPGFFGKQKTKAMKKQLDGNMLWRQLAEKRTTEDRVGGKKLSTMSPDERVEAMLKAGMI